MSCFALSASQGVWTPKRLGNPKPPAPEHSLLLRNSPCLLLGRFATTLCVSASGGAQQLGLLPVTKDLRQSSFVSA